MKSLDTLVEDIYHKLEPLCEGKPLDLTDKEIDEFGEALKKVIKQWAHPEERNANFSLRMSNIGKPARQLWFDKREKIDSKPTPATMIKFLYGHILEELVLVLARLSGHVVTDEQKSVQVEGITGHMDCKIDGEVVDVKTASSFAFGKFKYGSLPEDDSFGYLPQLAGYEAAEGTNKGGFLAINKENGELAMFVPEDLDKPNISSKIQSLKEAVESDVMPPRCWSEVPEGTKGNLKIHKNCQYCAYKHKCFSDANNGEGLRGFKYSKGVVYFSKIVSEPKVEEVL